MNKVKSISLDDMDELPNPIGGSPSDATNNKAMHYTPQYAGGGEMSNLGVGGGMEDEGTVRKGKLAEGFTRFTQVLGGKSLAGGVNRAVVMLGLLGSLLIAGGLYLYLGDEYIDQLLGDTGGTIDESGEMAAPSSELAAPEPSMEIPKSAIEVTTPAAEAPVMETMAVEEIPGNAYWKLPNPAPPMIESPPAISPPQSDGWRAGLNHPFHFQRLKATQEMRKAKVDGSVSILYEALAQAKFWTRMEAAIGIAEHGVAIDTVSMRTAIGDARPDLVKNYFKRFRRDYSDATAHVMRQALRVVDGRARLIILMNLAAHRNEVNDQYLMSASLNETDEAVKRTVSGVLARYPILATSKAAYEKSMSEEAVVVTAPKRKMQDDIKVEKIPANMNVEEVYFINDEDAVVAEPAAPVEEKKVDDGFNDLQHTDEVSGESQE